MRAVAHITGGGIPGNLARVLPPRVDAVVERSAWESPRIFGEIQRLGEVSDDEMAKVFNLGIGMIVVVPEDDVYKALDVLRSAGQRAVGHRLDHHRHRRGAPGVTGLRRAAAVLLAVVTVVAAGCHSPSPDRLQTCLSPHEAVRPWRASDGPLRGTPWFKVTAFAGMSGTRSDVVVVDSHGLVEAEGLRGGTFRGVLEPLASAMLATCVDAPAYAAVPATFRPDVPGSNGKFCAVADAADITIITSGPSGTKRVTANALDMVVGAYGPQTVLNCDLGYPAALRSLASALFELRAQVEAHGTRVA